MPVPRDTLTREEAVTAATHPLDAEGLEGMNMRAPDTRPGSAATAVYRHVGSFSIRGLGVRFPDPSGCGSALGSRRRVEGSRSCRCMRSTRTVVSRWWCGRHRSARWHAWWPRRPSSCPWRWRAVLTVEKLGALRW